jgi:putative nucleotidyltransferase with HDIG domain
MQNRLANRIEEAMARLEGDDPDRSKATLLVVDDEKGPRESLRMILSPQHRVLSAVDAHEALEILRDEEVDAVTVDLNMPGMKGDELMRKIRKDCPQIEVIIITGCSSVETAVEGIRHGVFDYLTKPFDVVEVSSTVRRALARRENRSRLTCFLKGIIEVLGGGRSPEQALGHLSEEPVLQERLHAALRDSQTSPFADEGLALEPARTGEFLETLAETIEDRVSLRSGHSRRVAYIAGLLAERLGLTNEAHEEVRIASFLHDIGRIGAHCDDSDEEATALIEEEIISTHALLGAKLLQPLGFPPSVCEAIKHHHEKWDGSGSPDGLAEGDIPLIARIISVADALDDLTRDHPHRRALSRAAAIDALRASSGRALDPTVFKELVGLAESGLCEAGPILEHAFVTGDDPVANIVAATAWIDNNS